MEAVKAESRQKSQKIEHKEKAEELLQEYFIALEKSEECKLEINTVKEGLLELAEENEEWFVGKTATLDNGKLKWVASTKLKKPEGFDMAKFKKQFPNLVKVSESISTAQVRAYERDPRFIKTGITLETEDRFSIEKA